ncbi:hypothetical protein ABFA07_004802 [Porites harrisoni]
MDHTQKSSQSWREVTSCYAIQSIVRISQKGENTESVGSLLRAHTRRRTSRSIKERSDMLVDFTGTDFSDPKTVFFVEKSQEEMADVLRYRARGKNYYLCVNDSGEVKLHKLIQFPRNNKYFFLIEKTNNGFESPVTFKSLKTKQYLYCDEHGKAFMGNANSNEGPRDRQAWFTFIEHKGHILLPHANGNGVESEDDNVHADMEDGNSRDSGRRNLDILEMDMYRERREHSSEIIIYVSAV